MDYSPPPDGTLFSAVAQRITALSALAGELRASGGLANSREAEKGAGSVHKHLALHTEIDQAVRHGDWRGTPGITRSAHN